MNKIGYTSSRDTAINIIRLCIHYIYIYILNGYYIKFVAGIYAYNRLSLQWVFYYIFGFILDMFTGILK